MTRSLPPRISWWRLWSLQGSFNPRRMQALGWWVAMAGAWRRRGLDAAELRERLAREPASPNTNPYLAGLVFGAALRLDEEGDADRASLLGKALSRVLGGIGDRATWTGARPVMASLAVLGALAWSPWFVVGVAGLFAVAQAWLRRRCFQEGYRRGEAVLELLERPWIQRSLEAAERLAAVLAGAVVVQVLWVSRPMGAFSWPSVAVALLVLGVGALLAWRRAAAELWLVALALFSYWRSASAGSP